MTKTLFLSFIMLSVTSFAQDSIRDREFSGKISGGLTIYSKGDFKGLGGQLNMGYSWLTKRNDLVLNTKIGHNLFLNYTSFASDLVPDNGNLSIFNLCFDWSLIFRKTDPHHPLFRFSYEPSIGFCVGYHSDVLTGGTSNPQAPGPTIYYSESGTHLGVIFTPLSFNIPLGRQYFCFQTPIQLLIINRRPVPTFSVTIGTKFG